MTPDNAVETRWCCLPDADAVCIQATELILAAATAAIIEHGCFKLVLAGGRTPEQIYRQLAGSVANWSAWQIYFGDERCLPAADAARNSVMAADTWLKHVPVPKDNVHPIPAEQGAVAAAQAYASLVSAARPFDLVLLGMGEDGHTASLFPGHQHPSQEVVHAVHDAPKPPPERVSLSRASLSDAHEVLVLVTGAGKQQALQQWRSGEALPIAGITAGNGMTVLMDEVACGINEASPG